MLGTFFWDFVDNFGMLLIVFLTIVALAACAVGPIILMFYFESCWWSLLYLPSIAMIKTIWETAF